MEGFFSSKVFEFAIGALFVALHAYGRYNTPESNRSSTTRLRFIACFALYAAALLAIYWMVTVIAWVSPEILEKAMQLIGGAPGGDIEGRDLFRSPITTALIFTALLPNFPLLKKGDQRLLQIFWDLAEIPGHAVKLAHRMYRAPYHIFPNKYDELEREAKYYDIHFHQEGFSDHSSPAFAWARACSLLLEIKQWHTPYDIRYQRFIQNREGEYEALKMQFSTLSARVAAYYRRLGEMGGKHERIEQDMRESLVSDGRDLFMKLCRLMAHAVLSAETGHQARRRAIESFGFEWVDDEVEDLSATQMFQLLSLIMLALMAVSTIRYAGSGGISGRIIGEIIFFAFLMGANYVVAAFIGIFPKNRWRFADIEATRTRPWMGYAVSGALAVVTSLTIISALRFTRYIFDGRGYEKSFNDLLIDLSWSYPHFFVALAIGFGVAWVCDTDWRATMQKHRRVADSLSMALIVLAASYVAYAAMHGLAPFSTGTKAPAFQDKSLVGLLHFLAQCTLAAVLIGALVPMWFRKNRYRTPNQRINRFVAHNSHDLKVEAGKLEYKVLIRPLTLTAAATAMADGILDDAERDVFRAALTKLAEHDILDFRVEEGMEEMMRLVELWREGDTASLREQTIESLHPLRGKEQLGELVIQICAAIGFADGVFQAPEQYMLEQVVSALNRNLESELAACGLALRKPSAAAHA
ncbi:TerB family tellurite resistance protein [Marinobacteraceae bacterium S3BR75-40.1]